LSGNHFQVEGMNQLRKI